MGTRHTGKWTISRPSSLFTSRSRPLAVLALLVCLLITAWGWYQSREQVWGEASNHFDFRVNETLKAIDQRMVAYEQVLRGGVAFLHGSESVTREEWRTYVSQLALPVNYPGILGTGYTVYLRQHEVAALEREVRASSGFADFEVWPKGQRDVYTAILYLEPFDWRNQRAFGYDMYSQPTRRAAMAQARDTGQPAVTGKVMLVQETDQDAQAGFLMYLPVYRGGTVPTTMEERRSSILGFVYSPFRMDDLMLGIRGETAPEVLMRIYDGDTLSESALMYGNAATARQPAFETVRSLDINGRPWTVYLASRSSLEKMVLTSGRPTFVLASGLLLSGLLFTLLWTMAGTEARATAIARTMTEAFQHSEAKFASLVQAAMDAIIITDSSGRIVSWNRGATEMFGYQEDTVIGQPWTRILPKRLHEEYIRGQRAAVSGHGPLLRRVLALSAVRENGEEFPVEVSLARWGVGDEIFLSAIIRDTSERHRVEQALRLSEARFRTTFENAAIGVMLTDLDGRILEANPALGQMLGYDPASLREMDQSALVHPEDRSATDQLTEALQDGSAAFIKQQKRYVRRDGSIVWGSLTASMIRSDQGQPLTLLRMIEDVTELRAAEEALTRAYRELEQRVEARTRELRQQTEELARSNAELEQFAYVASHDLQEPLRSVSGFAQLLERRYKDQLGEEGLTFVHYIVTGTDRMRGLITDLLAYSRAGAREKPHAAVDMEAVLDQVLFSLAGSINERRAVIVREPLPVVYGDAAGLEQLLLNLIGNALKFNQSLPPRVEIDAQQSGEDWRFSVRDNGIGINPEFSPRLFTIFQRGHRRDEYAGTGIGLAICKKVVESHRGQIWAESQPSNGTAFFFTLPRMPAQEIESSVPQQVGRS